MEQLPNNPAIICAHLLRQGYVRKNRIPLLEVDEELLKAVRQNLAQVGMELVYNSYSPYYAVRLAQQVQESIEQSNNMGLKSNEVAMLVILWCKLILPKRLDKEASISGQIAESAANQPKAEEAGATAPVPPQELAADVPPAPPTETGENPEQPVAVRAERVTDTRSGLERSESPLPDEEEAVPSPEDAAEDREKIYIRLNELYAEFGEQFGSRTAFKATITRLSNLQFIRIYNEVITEGILLDLLVDGYQMANEIKKSALAFKLAGIADEEEEWELDDSSEEEQEGEEPKAPEPQREEADQG